MPFLGIKGASIRGHTPPALPLLLLGLLLPTLPDATHCLFRQVLSEYTLDDLLLPRPAIANHDEDTSRDIHHYRAAEDRSGKGHGPDTVVDAPSAEAQCQLEAGVEVEQTDDGDEEAEWEGVVRLSLVWFVEGVGLGELLLMVLEPTLLLGSQDRNLLFGVVERGF